MSTIPIPIHPFQSGGIRPLPEDEPVNPTNEELKQAHAALSPQAQQAISLAGPMQQPAAPEAIPLAKTSPAPAMSPATPSGAIPISGPVTPTPSAAIPINPRMQGARDRLAHLTIPEHPGTTDPRLMNERPGVGQIHSGAIRIPLQILDAISSGLLPNIAMGIPGTSAHHALLTNQAAGAEAEQEGQANADVKRAQETAQTEAIPTETDLKKAQADEMRATAESKLHPQPKVSEGKTIETADGIMQLNPDTGKYDIRVGDAPGKNAVQHVVSSDGSVIAIHTNAKTGETTHEVIYHGDPKVKTEVKQLQVNGKPHQVLVNSESGDTIKDLGESGEKPPVVNVNAETNRQDRSYDKRNAELTAIGKPITDLNQRLGRLQDTLAQNTPQADALVAPELLTVMAGGMGSGLRMNEAEIARIIGGRSKWESLKAAINQWQLDPKAALSITPEQRQEIRSLTSAVGWKLTKKQDILNEAYRGLAATDDVKEHRRIIDSTREQFSKIDKGEAEGGTVDPKLKSYADEFFGGDIAKAQAHIDQQKGAKK